MLKTVFKFLLITLVFSAVSCTTTDGDPGGVENDRDKFLGSWNVSDQPARINYIVRIDADPLYSSQVIMNNFGDLGSTVVGIVINNTVVIDQQDAGSGFSTEGSGNYVNASTLQFEFFLDDGIDKELRKASFSK